ncbi:DUF3817 domain-containing protein [Chitinophaga pinensis]|uniref:DUF3817 domain-containing protein n=1 Tax=Chitinophaga pinensis TaxID=79329 RepID=A0A5C6LV12_9BACT|nr:DUF3817 domain-containing protein [Chitinophaga pinensis]TWW00408.1 DUF3817 domain-containing protein [Chitinophaga pinensis]
MASFFKTSLGRLRLVSYMEGISLLVLAGIAVPLKYWAGDPVLVRIIGPVHGILFLLFIVLTLSVGVERQWSFTKTTLRILISCFIPFATFYVDKHILKKEAEAASKNK